MSFVKQIEIRWADCDANKHVRHSAYYDFGAHSRIKFLAENGYSARKMEELKIGPILFKESCSFIREVHMNDTISINILRGNISEDGSKWELHHEIMDEHGNKIAHISMKGAWMDLEARKLTVPPSKLASMFKRLPLGEEYVYRKS